MNELKRELNYLKVSVVLHLVLPAFFHLSLIFLVGCILVQEFVRAMRSSHPAMRAIADQFEKDEVKRWASSLPKAKVSRWGAMISTPDYELQVRIALYHLSISP